MDGGERGRTRKEKEKEATAVGRSKAEGRRDETRRRRRRGGGGNGGEPEGWRSVGGASKASVWWGLVVAGACGRDATRRGVSVSPQSTSSRRDACVFSLVGLANLARLACPAQRD